MIGKLRHESASRLSFALCVVNSPPTAVIINEHLVEALRRLRKSSTETNVDRRLVTNVILSFLTTPRADSKRFEMLKLLASILQWTDSEKEKAGIAKSSSAASATSPSLGFWGRSISSSGNRSPVSPTDADKPEDSEVCWYLVLSHAFTDALCSPSPDYGWNSCSLKQQAQERHHKQRHPQRAMCHCLGHQQLQWRRSARRQHQ